MPLPAVPYAIPVLLLLLLLSLSGCQSRLAKLQEHPSGQADQDYFTAMRLLVQDSAALSIPYFEKLIATYPQEGLYPNLLAREYAHIGELDSATKYQAQAIQLDSTNVYYLQQMYQWEEMKLIGQQEDPLTVSRRLVDLSERLTQLDSTKGQYWYYLAVNLMRSQRPAQSIRVVKGHYKQLEGLGGTDLLLANCYMQLHQCDSAQAQVERMVQRSRGGGQEHFMASEICLYCNQREQAVHHYLNGLRYSCPPWSLTSTILEHLANHPGQMGFGDVLRRLRADCGLESTQVYEAVETLLRRAPQDSLRAPSNLAILDSLLSELPKSPANLRLRYRFAEYVTPEKDQRATTRAMTDQEPHSTFVWMLRLREEWRWAQRTQRAEDWQIADSTIAEMMRRNPMDLNPLLLQLSRLLLQSEGKVSTQYERLLDQYISRYKGMHKNSSRRKEVIVVMSSGDTVTLEVKRTLASYISLLLCSKGDYMVQIGQPEGAWSLYEQALKYEPDSQTALNNYAYFLALYAPERLTLARELSEKSNALSKYTNPTFLDTYGYILYLAKDYEASRQIFIKLLSIEANPGRTTLLHYSEVLRALGKNHAADLYKMKAQDAPAE